MKKLNTAERNLFKYLLTHQKIENAYLVAKSVRQLNNQAQYNKAIKHFVDEDIIKNQDGYYVFTPKNEGYLQPMIKEILLEDDCFINMVLSGKKLLFIEWSNLINKIGQVVSQQYDTRTRKAKLKILSKLMGIKTSKPLQK